jgi:hypothetical protein
MRAAVSVIAAALLAVAVLVGPTGAPAAATVPQGPATPASTGELAFVQALPDQLVDVYLAPTLYLVDFSLGQRTSPDPLPSGDHRVRVFTAGADPAADEPLVDQVVNLPAGSHRSVVISEVAAGTVGLTTFVDDPSPTSAGTATLVARNVAAVGDLALDVDDHIAAPDIGPGGQGSAWVVAGRHDLDLVVTGAAVEFADREVAAGSQVQLYLIGQDDPETLFGLLFEVEVGQTAAFTDVPVGHPFFDAIAWVWVRGIAAGYPDDTFAPAAAVSRQAGAAFLYRAAGSPLGLDPVCEAAPFTDVPTEHPFCGEINWAVGEQITSGYPDGTFLPDGDITRQAMSSFLYRFAGSPSGADPACAAPPFTDVPTDHPFCGEIAWMAAEGISTGYPDDTYQPGRTVSRQAAAAFLELTAP